MADVETLVSPVQGEREGGAVTEVMAVSPLISSLCRKVTRYHPSLTSINISQSAQLGGNTNYQAITYSLFIIKLMNNGLDSQLIHDSLQEYLVSSPPTTISYINHSLIGDNAIHCHLNQQLCLGYYQILDYKSFFPTMQQLYIMRTLNTHGVFVQFLGVWLEEHEVNSFTLYVLFEKLDESIKELLTVTPFSESRFWNSLVDVSTALNFLQERKLHHGNINFYSLLSKAGEAKVFYFPHHSTSLKVWSQSQKDIDYLFLSPEEIRAHKQDFTHFSIHKSDMFNFGVLLISVLLNSSGHMFINGTLLEESLSKIQTKYGFNVYFLLERMTRMEAESRLEWYEVEAYVKQLRSGSGKVQHFDFRQGTFQRIGTNDKNPISEKLRKSTEILTKKRKLIFDKDRRNLLELEQKPRHQRREAEVVTSEGCMTAHCYMKM